MIKLSTKNIKAWVVSLHDHNHWTPSSLWLYGKEVINIQSSIAAGTWRRYQVEPTEVNHVNQVNNPCISDESNLTIIGDCVIDHVLSGLNCNLPWRIMKTNYPLCSSSDEYDHFWSKSRKAMDHNTYYVEKEAKCTPGCRRVEYSAKLQGSGKTKSTEEVELSFYFTKDKFLVKEQFFIYDTANLLADLGGYLGLLLGYSMLGFFDPLMDLIEYVRRQLN